MGYIYSLSDPRSGELRYVGKTRHTLQWRLSAHLSPSSRARHCRLSRWLLGLFKVNVRPCIEALEVVDEDELNTRERHWIAGLRATGHRLVNGTDGGDGLAYWTGKKRSPETIAKMSLAMKGRKLSEAHRAKLRGRKLSVEHRAKISSANKGRKLSAEVRAQLAAKARLQVGIKNGKWKPVDIETIVRRRNEGASFRQIARELGLTPPHVVRHFKKAF